MRSIFTLILKLAYGHAYIESLFSCRKRVDEDGFRVFDVVTAMVFSPTLSD